MASYRIQLPDRLTLRHRHIIAVFLRDDLRQSDWSLATEAFGILGEALFITPERSLSFQRLYAEMVDEKYGILFEAHDLTIPADRFTPYDLLVSGLTGDIKTSLYFVQLARRFAVDFFVVRLHIKSKSVTVAVLLRPKAWDELNEGCA